MSLPFYPERRHLILVIRSVCVLRKNIHLYVFLWYNLIKPSFNMAESDRPSISDRLMASIRRKYDTPSEKRPEQVAVFAVEQFKHLIPSPVDVNVLNSDGLLPLQVALVNFTQIGWNKLIDLKLLMPSSVIASMVDSHNIVEHVLNTDLDSDEIMEFFGVLKNSGFDCSSYKVWSVALAANTCSIDVITRLMVVNGIKPSLEDLEKVFEKYLKGCWAYGELILKMLVFIPRDVIKTLNVTMPQLFPESVEIDLLDIDHYPSFHCIELLIEQGYTMNVADYYTMAKNVRRINNDEPESVLWSCLRYVPPEIVEQINCRSPNLFDVIMNITGYAFFELYSVLDEYGFKVSAINIKNAIDSYKVEDYQYHYVICCLLQLANNGLELNGVLSDPITKIFSYFGSHSDMMKRYENDLTEARQQFCQIVKFLVDNDYEPTIDHCRAALRWPWIGILAFELLFNALTPSLKVQISVEVPDMLNRMLRCFLTESEDHEGNVEDEEDEQDEEEEKVIIEHDQSLCDLVDTLLDECNIDLNYCNEEYGFVLHNIVDISCVGVQYKWTALKILPKILERKELNIDKTLRRTLIGNGGKKRIVEERAIDLAMSHGQFQVVNKLIYAGADCDGLNLLNARGKPESFMTFKLLYKIGIPIDIHPADKVSDWIKSRPMQTLLEHSVIAMRRNFSRIKLNSYMLELGEKDLGFSKMITKFFELKHVDFN